MDPDLAGLRALLEGDQPVARLVGAISRGSAEGPGPAALDDETRTRAIACAAALDGGPHFASVATGARAALSLFDLHREGAVGIGDLEDDQRRDVAVRALLIGVLGWHLGEGTPADRAAAFQAAAGAGALLDWFCSVDVALAFASEYDPPGRSFVSDVVDTHGDAAAAALGDVVPGWALSGARELLKSLLARLDADVGTRAGEADRIAEAVRAALPVLGEGGRAELAAEAAKLRVYGALVARMIGEAPPAADTGAERAAHEREIEAELVRTREKLAAIDADLAAEQAARDAVARDVARSDDDVSAAKEIWSAAVAAQEEYETALERARSALLAEEAEPAAIDRVEDDLAHAVADVARTEEVLAARRDEATATGEAFANAESVLDSLHREKAEALGEWERKLADAHQRLAGVEADFAIVETERTTVAEAVARSEASVSAAERLVSEAAAAQARAESVLEDARSASADAPASTAAPADLGLADSAERDCSDALGARRRALEAAGSHLDAALAELDAARREKAELDDRTAALEAAIVDARAAIQAREAKRQDDLERRCAEVRARLAEVDAELANAEADEAEVGAAVDAAHDRLLASIAALEASREEHAGATTRLAEAREAAAALPTVDAPSLDAAARGAGESEAALADVSARLDARRNEAAAVASALSDLASMLASNRQEKDEWDRNVAACEAGVAATRTDIARNTADLDAARARPVVLPPAPGPPPAPPLPETSRASDILARLQASAAAKTGKKAVVRARAAPAAPEFVAATPDEDEQAATVMFSRDALREQATAENQSADDDAQATVMMKRTPDGLKPEGEAPKSGRRATAWKPPPKVKK